MGPSPVAVPADLGRGHVQDLVDLLQVGAGVLGDLLAGLAPAHLAASGGVADHAGEVADDQHDGVAEALELGQLAEHHRVAQGQVGGRGVDAQLDPERPALRGGLAQAGLQLPGRQHAGRPGGEDAQLLGGGLGHG
jgi:hypothetical protein